jgi:hypothetical protein
MAHVRRDVLCTRSRVCGSAVQSVMELCGRCGRCGGATCDCETSALKLSCVVSGYARE